MSDPPRQHRDEDAGRTADSVRDEDGVRLYVERMAMTFADVGFPRMAARVLFLVTSADEPLTAAEIGKRLDASPAAISGAVRHLMHLGLLTREPVPGSRRDRYRAPEDGWMDVAAVKGGIYKTFADLSDEGAEAAGRTTPGGQRIERMRDFFIFVQRELDMIGQRWHESRGTQPPGRRTAG